VADITLPLELLVVSILEVLSEVLLQLEAGRTQVTQNPFMFRVLPSDVLLQQETPPKLHSALFTFRHKVIILPVYSEHMTGHLVPSKLYSHIVINI